MSERKFDNIESCVECLDGTVLPIIRNLDCGETLALTICCGENELYIHIPNYNKELDEISFNYKMINLAEDTRMGESFNCEPMVLFFSMVKSFLQGYCLENLYEGNCIRIDFLIMEADLCADVNEEYEYVEDEEDIKQILNNTIWNYLDEFGGVRLSSEKEHTNVHIYITLKGYEDVVSEDNCEVSERPILEIKTMIGETEKICSNTSECIELLFSINPNKIWICLLDGRVAEYISVTSDEHIKVDVHDEIEREQKAISEYLKSLDDDLPF